MYKIWNLFLLQFKEYHPKLFSSSKKQRLLYAALYILGGAVICVAANQLLALCCRTFLLAPDQIILSVLLLALSAVSIVMAIFGIIKTVYFAKDNRLFVTFPVTGTQIFISKFLTIFVNEILNSAVFILPTLIGFGILAQATFSYYLLLPVVLVMLVLFCQTISALLAVPVMFAVNLIKKNIVLSIISISVLLALVFYAYMSLLSSILVDFNLVGQTTAVIEKVRKTLAAIAEYSLFFKLFADILFLTNFWAAFGIMLAVSVLGTLGVFFLNKLSFDYFSRPESKRKRIVKVCEVQANSPLKSIIKKDILAILRSPSYIFQFFLFALIMPLFVYSYNRLLSIIDLGNLGINMAVGANVLLFALLALLSCTYSATAVTREGGNFFIMKITPADFRYRAISAIIINAFAVLSMTLISVVIIVAVGYISVTNGILLLLLTALLVVGHSANSFEYDLASPILDWYDTSDITDNSKASVHSIAFGIIFGSILGIVSIALTVSQLLWVSWLAVLIIAALFAGIKLWLLFTRINYYFRKIEV